MSKNKKLYIVVKGAATGIFEHWHGAGGAAEQVSGFQNALYKSFTTVEAAREWLLQLKEKEMLIQLERFVGGTPQPKPVSSPKAALQAGKVFIYTDGGAIRNPGPGGYGVVLLYKGHKKELSGGFRYTTNNRMELYACIVGFEALKYRSSVILHSDSKYVIDGLDKGWARRWQARGWMRTKTEKAKNVDLWERLLTLCAKHDLQFKWVKGHAGHKYNERCDQLATEAAQRSNQPPDKVFEAELNK